MSSDTAVQPLSFTDDQQHALDFILDWYSVKDHPKNHMSLGGYAGTGKSTVLKEISARLKALDASTKVGVAAFTGKAVSVLRNFGVREAQTLHSLLYTPVFDDNGRVIDFVPVPDIDKDLVIVDEASMVNGSLYNDLNKYKTRVLFVGDPGQLEPIGNDPALMANPDIVLQQIHRQAKGSSIIAFSQVIREGKDFKHGKLPGLIVAPLRSSNDYIYGCDQVICGFNKTRHAINAAIRKFKNFDELLNVGDRVICLQNKPNLGLYNGLIATVTAVREDIFSSHNLVVDVKDELGNELKDIKMLRKQFGVNKIEDQRSSREVSLWDYAYAITCHKAQGSQWDKVVVIEEVVSDWNIQRWAYTAVTRAAKELVYCC